MTISTYQNTFISLFFVFFETSGKSITNAKIFFPGCNVMKLKSTYTFIIAANFTFTTFILNQKFFCFFSSSLNCFYCTFFTPIPSILP